MNGTEGSWDEADTANHELIHSEDAYTHNWVFATLSLPEDCLWDECED